jgi:hypothetical protein
MDDKVMSALEVLKERVARSEATTADLKRAANALAMAEGLPPIYTEIVDPSRASFGLRADEFANQATPGAAARAFLKLRSQAASLDEIHDALIRGGFAFGEGVGDTKAALRIALGKDANVHRLPNGAYGLLEWYPAKKRERQSADEAEAGNGDDAKKAKKDDVKKKPVTADESVKGG